MDIYNDFFSRHDLTYFCQIRFLKPLIDCPYQEQLSVVMAKAYELGNFNASLFSTEGIASVGPLFAPVSVFACGLGIALANRLSSGLPPRLILISGAALPQIPLNVPLTTTLVSHGAAMLMLWYIMPRSLFRQDSTRETPPQPVIAAWGLPDPPATAGIRSYSSSARPRHRRRRRPARTSILRENRTDASSAAN